ncbi:ATP-binding protein [Patescibacteria group bacterium]|nr:ATP-binding protein [Patescibacteria group bacterium]
MPSPYIIIISGPSCTGKTTLAQKIIERFPLPYLSKDGVKEILFDKVGWRDRAWSQKLGGASYAVLHYFMESLLTAGTSFIVESNFKAEFANQEFQKLMAKYHFTPIQIMCQCQGDILFERFKARSVSGLRHPGHCDTGNYDEFKDLLLRGQSDPLDLDGEIIIFDSTDLEHLDYPGLLHRLAALLPKNLS